MKTLIIIANPSKTSFSHIMAKKYSKKCENFEILDLYDFKQNFLKYESKEELYKWNSEESEKIKETQEKIINSDEMVFFFPVWWWGVPAILKNFFDANFSSWFAFEYDKLWNTTKLLTNKTAKVFCTCDAPWFIYNFSFFMWINLKKFLNKAIFDFCWIKLTEFKMLSKFHIKSEEEKNIFLKNL